MPSGLGSGVGLGENSPSVGARITSYFALGGGWWDFVSGSVTLDSSGNGNTVTENGIPTYTGSGGKPGQYINLAAASTQYDSLADNASVSMGTGVSFSLGGWANLASGGGLRRIIAKGDRATAANCEYSLGFNNAARFELTVSSGAALASVTDTAVSVSNGVWYFVVGVFDLAAGLIKISVNGNSFVTAAFAGPVPNGANEFRIGNDTVGVSRLWDGSLDSVFVVKAALTIAEVLHIYNGGAGRLYSGL